MEINCTVTDSTFIRNVADVGGGGIGMGFTSDGTFGRENCIYFFNLTLYNNKANFGGGLYIIPGGNGGHGNLVTMEFCNLTGNIAPSYGAAVAMAALQGYLDHSLLRETTYIDNMFERNDGGAGGVLSTYYFTVVFKGTNRFLNNTGTSLRVVSAIVHVHGTLEFSNNFNLFGASVYLSSYGQLLLFNGTSLLLHDNKGNIGAAMEVEPLYAEPFLVGIRGNSQCFLIYQNPFELQDDWNVTLSFSGNEANIGSAIYTREVGLCSYVSDRFPHINMSESFNTKPFKYSGNTNTAQKPSNATQFNIATPAVNFSVANVANNASFFPGEEFHVVVSGWDEFGNPTQGVYRIQEDRDESEDEYSLRFRPSSINVFPGAPRVTLQFASDMDEFDRDLHTILFEHERTSRTDSFLRYEVKLAPDLCPPGTVFTSAAASLFQCQCDTSNEDILSCEPNGHDIILRRGLWGVSYPDPDTFRYILKTMTCPPGFCQCTTDTSQNNSICHYVYRHTNDDYQCQCFREGILCGSCVNGTSVSALLDNCVTCGDENSIVIVVLIIADVVVMVTVMIVSLWKPLNPPAWLYPLLFYIQVTPYAARFWPVTFEYFQPYLAYIGNLLGLYLPYDFCLYSTATSLEVYGLRYIPFVLALIICPTVLLIACVAKVKVNFSGVWLLVMLLFNQVLHTSVAVLSCANVYDKAGVQSSVWYYDGSIQCFSGGHAALGVWAILCILVLMFLMFSPLVPVVIPMKLRSRQLRSVRDAVMYVYRDRYYWCYVVELVRRFLVIIIMVSTPATASGTIFLLMVTFMWYAYTKPYKQRLVNYLEIFLLFDFLILLLLYQLSSTLSYVMELEEVQLLTYMEGCDNPQYTPTYRAIMLALLYYLPIYTLPVVLLVYVLYKVKDKCMMVKCKRHISKDAPSEGVELKEFSLRKNTIIIENVVDLDSTSTVGSFPDGPPS